MIIYGIINDVINGQPAPIDIQLFDISKCFDESDDKERRRLEKRVKSLEKEVVAKKEVIADLAEEAINVKKKLHRP